jgi:hypothetical protein
MNCEHNKRIGDNYGVTCQDCGEILEGYGNGGWFGSNLKGNEQCKHVWLNMPDRMDYEQCMYCFREREREKKAN